MMDSMNSRFEAVIFDVDGVLEFQGVVYPGAVELLDHLRKRDITIRIITDSTLKSRKTCAEKLRAGGFRIDPKEIITASYATAQYLKTLNPRSCWVMLKGQGLEEFSGLHLDDHDPEYIVLGDLREDFNFHNMNKALKLLLQGSKLVVMITEMVDTGMGDVELTVGAYGKMLEEAAHVRATYIGKPNRTIFDIALKTLDIKKSKILMVGDRIQSDILGAKNVGIRSALVKTGEFKDSDLDGDVTPDYLCESIEDLRSILL
jgi:HAD superfamily hydrolase (TIGR01458 family)